MSVATGARHVAERVRRDDARRRRLRDAMAVARLDAAACGRDVSVAEVQARRRRNARYQLRDVMQSMTSRDRLATCGRKRIAPEVSLRLGSRGAGFAGLAHCESIWSCPTCAASIRNVRAQEIQAGVSAHIAGGGGGLFVTLTLPHGKTDPLRGLLKQITQGWGAMLRDRAGRAWRGRLGMVGYVRAVEVTHGANGWHPHLHLLVLTSAPVLDDTREAFAGWLQARWMSYASDRAWKGTGGQFGATVQDVVADDGLSKYVAKVQDEAGIDRVLGVELARGDMKSGRGSSTPFELLAQVVELRRSGLDHDGRHERRLAGIWREYEAETAGLSALRWSKGLRALLGVAEVSDAQILAEQDLGDDARTVVAINATDWMVICRQGARGELLDVAERSGGKAARQFIAAVVLRDLSEWAAGVESSFEPEPPPPA